MPLSKVGLCRNLSRLKSTIFLLVNSRGYCKFQVEIGVATNPDLISKLLVKHNYGFQPCTTQLSEVQLLTGEIQ